MRRVAVVGAPGAGKSTFAGELARRLDVPHVELDRLFWGPGWTPSETVDFQDRVTRHTTGDGWIVDGNYTWRVSQTIWPRLDTFVWLDYPLHLTLVNLARRSARRVLSREHLWNGNRETFRGSFLGRDALLMWAVTSHASRRREYAEAIESDELAAARVMRFRTRRAAYDWLEAGLPMS